jgi:hypothetical protein
MWRGCRRVLLTLLVAMATLSTGPSWLAAQGAASRSVDTLPTAIPGSILGVVVDSSNVPIPDIAVYLYEARQQVRTGRDGRFRFDNVGKGKYTLSARSVGFLGVTERINVKAAGATVRLQLTRLARGLPAVITTADRTGLSGVVADTSLRPLRDVSVRIMGTGLTTKSDSLGRFYLPVKPGSYLMRFERDGYDRQLMGLSMPPTQGREVAIWMTKSGVRENPLIGANLFEFDQRRIRARQVTYANFSRDDLIATGALDLMQAAARATSQRVDFDACAYLDGGPAFAPLWALPVGDTEFMEASVPGNTGRNAVDIIGRPASARGSCSYNVWLRR